MRLLRVDCVLEAAGLDSVPRQGSAVVANHPFGGIEGLALLARLRCVCPEVKVPARRCAPDSSRKEAQPMWKILQGFWARRPQAFEHWQIAGDVRQQRLRRSAQQLSRQCDDLKRRILAAYQQR